MRAHPAHRRHAWVLAAIAGTCLTACASQPGHPTPDAPNHERTTTIGATPPDTTDGAAPSGAIAVQLTIGESTIDGELWDNPTARELAARLPLTLTFSDLNDVEKTAKLDPALTMDGMPAGDDPNPGEIGWYAPSSDLVLYYGEVGYWTGIARIGTFDARGTALLANAPDQVTVTFAPTI